MTDWHSGDVDANGVRLHYTRAGQGPTLVLAHGFSDDGPCWTPIAESLVSDDDVVMFDARGHGRSEAPEGVGYGAAEQAADLAGGIQALGLVRPAVLGHSMGGVTALALGGLYPNLPRALLLEDPGAPWVPRPAGEAPARRGGGRHWVLPLKEKTREELIDDQRAAAPTWPEAELAPWADSKLRLSPRVLEPPESNPMDWPAVLRRIACPTLLLTADPALGAIITDDSAALLRSFVPQLQTVHIPGAGHNIRREQPAAYLAAVRAFLEATR